MRVSFTLPDSAAVLLRLSADRIALELGERKTPAAIARALVLEVLTDDAEMHGLMHHSEAVN